MSKSKEPNIKSILVKLYEYNRKNNVEKIIETIEELKEIEIDGKKINLKEIKLLEQKKNCYLYIFRK